VKAVLTKRTAYRLWTPEEDAALARAVRDESSLADLARGMGRTPDALLCRAYRVLRLLRPRARAAPKPRAGRESLPPFRPGQAVEFRSSDRGGCWKKGVVEAVMHENGQSGAAVRIRTGPGVWVIRKAVDCRVPEED
jgi:hypothetical protein